MISALQSYLFYVYNPHHPARHSMACVAASCHPAEPASSWYHRRPPIFFGGSHLAPFRIVQVMLVPAERWHRTGESFVCSIWFEHFQIEHIHTFTGQSFKKKVKSCEIRAPMMLSRYYRHAHLPEAPWIVLRRYSRPQRRTTDDRKQFDKLHLEANLLSKHCSRACCSHWVLSAVKFSGKRFPPTKRYGKPGVLDGAIGFCKATKVRAG